MIKLDVMARARMPRKLQLRIAIDRLRSSGVQEITRDEESWIEWILILTEVQIGFYMELLQQLGWAINPLGHVREPSAWGPVSRSIRRPLNVLTTDTGHYFSMNVRIMWWVCPFSLNIGQLIRIKTSILAVFLVVRPMPPNATCRVCGHL